MHDRECCERSPPSTRPELTLETVRTLNYRLDETMGTARPYFVLLLYQVMKTLRLSVTTEAIHKPQQQFKVSYILY